VLSVYAFSPVKDDALLTLDFWDQGQVVLDQVASDQVASGHSPLGRWLVGLHFQLQLRAVSISGGVHILVLALTWNKLLPGKALAAVARVIRAISPDACRRTIFAYSADKQRNEGDVSKKNSNDGIRAFLLRSLNRLWKLGPIISIVLE
jgi:hypothetical protein